MRIAVVGAGAMGSIVGAAVAHAGHDTTLVDVSQSLVDHLDAAGLVLVVDGEEHAVAVRATQDPGSVGPVDLVVFFVKCYHTSAAAEFARPLVGPDTTVASLQNGWGNGETLANAYSPEHLAIGVTYHSGTVLGPGRVGHTGRGPTIVGPYAAGAEMHAERLRTALADGGLEVVQTESIRTEIWKKLMLNCATLPTAALTGLTAGAIGSPGLMLDLVDALAVEAVGVARAAGHDIDAHERVTAINALLARGGAGKASMLQDLEAGRRTEIDVITGAVLRAADEHGIDAPLNRAMFSLVRGVEEARGLT